MAAQQQIQESSHLPANNTTQPKTWQQHPPAEWNPPWKAPWFVHHPEALYTPAAEWLLVATWRLLGFWLRVERTTSIKHVKSDRERADILIVRNCKNCKHATDQHHFPWPESKLLHLSSRSGQVHGHHQELSSELDKVAANACCKEKILVFILFFQRQTLQPQ